MITTTQKLLLATAVHLFGENDAKVRLYMVTRSPSFDRKCWSAIYRSISAEASLSGYSDVRDYCEDVRFATMSALAKLIPATRAAFDEYDEEIVVKEVLESAEEVNSFYAYEDRVPYLFIKRVAKEAVEEESDSVETRVSKRLWSRMSDSEKKFEDHFSGVEARAETSASAAPNPLRFFFPATKSEKERRPASNEDQYNQLINKLVYNRKTSKDKATWPGDYKMMVKHLIAMVKESESDLGDLAQVANERPECLQDAVLRVMETIQKMIFESKNAPFIKKLSSFKYKFSLLNDFYRR